MADSLIEAEEITSNDKFVSYPVMATFLHDAVYTVMQCLQESLPHHMYRIREFLQYTNTNIAAMHAEQFCVLTIYF